MQSQIHLDPNQVPAVLRHGYNGRKFRAVVSTTVHVASQQWDGGSRDTYRAVRLADGASAAASDPRPWPESMGTVGEMHIPAGVVIVEHSIFCGKDMGLTFHVRPENAGLLITDQAGDDFTLAQRAVLYGTQSYKSSYSGQDRYQMTCSGSYADFPSVSRGDWENAKNSLIDSGHLNKRGALTTKGKNAAQSVKRERS